MGPLDRLPDVRDGLTRVERIVLHTLHLLEQERPGRRVPIAQLYGRVVERIDVSMDEVYAIVQRMADPAIERR
jgi:hypothetical protein